MCTIERRNELPPRPGTPDARPGQREPKQATANGLSNNRAASAQTKSMYMRTC